MKFSAYMFIRNGIKAGYTFMEAIENALPFVDEFYILEGNSDDGTAEALRRLAAFSSKIRLESREPKYLKAAPDQKGLLLGQVFEEAREACRGDWLVQVQADTVFHPVTLYCARAFLERGDNARDYGAVEVVRHQYRWNWQDMYRRDNLALIFRKEAGRVIGDAINVGIKGRISRALLPLFERYPAADNAWVFFENIAGKVEGCREIWANEQMHRGGPDFPWYDRATGRSFRDDWMKYKTSAELPPFWQEKASPFAAKLPANLIALSGLRRYGIQPRFSSEEGLYRPAQEETAAMAAEAASLRRPPREVLLNLLGL